MRAPSKNPDDYLVGQPGHPPGDRPPDRLPARLALSVYFSVWAVTALVARLVGVDWDHAFFPIGLLGGGVAHVSAALWWSRTHPRDLRT